VDARHGEAELDEHAECVAQVGMADRLVVTKTDLTGGVVPESLLARIGALNPHATVTSVRPGVLDPAAVLGLDDAGERSAEAVPSAGAARLFAAPVANARHATDIVTESFVIERPATWSGLAGWMDAVREFFGAKMLRCKGLLLVAEAGRPVVVQGVQGVFAQPETLAGWPGEDHRSRLVCISRGLEPGLVQASLGLLHAEAGTYRPATLAELKHAAAAPRGTTP
jgi:G3E family GTPase